MVVDVVLLLGVDDVDEDADVSIVRARRFLALVDLSGRKDDDHGAVKCGVLAESPVRMTIDDKLLERNLDGDGARAVDCRAMLRFNSRCR